MNWLFDIFALEAPQLKEPKVDCVNCQLKEPLKRVGTYSVKVKCCEFSPFWSAFAVGAWLKSGNTLQSLKAIDSGEMILTSIGILHTLKHRSIKESRCLLFNSQANNCSIWAQRPPTCYTFFCASEHKTGISQYSILEDWFLSIESAAIRIYFEKRKFGPEVWEKWVEYMEPEPEPESFPNELLLHNYSEAESFYKDMYSWLKESSECELLRHRVKQAWKSDMANYPLLGIKK